MIHLMIHKHYAIALDRLIAAADFIKCITYFVKANYESSELGTI